VCKRPQTYAEMLCFAKIPSGCFPVSVEVVNDIGNWPAKHNFCDGGRIIIVPLAELLLHVHKAHGLSVPENI